MAPCWGHFWTLWHPWPPAGPFSSKNFRFSIFVGPPLQLSRFWVAKGTILGPIWDQNGTSRKGGTVPVILWCPTLATSSAEGLQTSIFVGPPLQLSWFWVAKVTILGPFWAQFWTKNGTVLGQVLDALA